jgi:hypothetical protein
MGEHVDETGDDFSVQKLAQLADDIAQYASITTNARAMKPVSKAARNDKIRRGNLAAAQRRTTGRFTPPRGR